MRYSELFTGYVTYLLKLKRRKITKREFKEALEDEGLEVLKTSKSIDGERVNGYFIEGLTFKGISIGSEGWQIEISE